MASKEVKIYFLGEPGAGKTSLLTRYFIGVPSENLPIVEDIQQKTVTYQNVEYIVHGWDSACASEYDEVRRDTYYGTSVVILCISVESDIQVLFEKWMREIEDYFETGTSIVVCITKSDMVSNSLQQQCDTLTNLHKNIITCISCNIFDTSYQEIFDLVLNHINSVSDIQNNHSTSFESKVRIYSLKVLLYLNHIVFAVLLAFMCEGSIPLGELGQIISTAILIGLSAIEELGILYLIQCKTWTLTMKHLFYVLNIIEIITYLYAAIVCFSIKAFKDIDIFYISFYGGFVILVILEKVLEIFFFKNDIEIIIGSSDIFIDKDSIKKYIRILPYNLYQRYGNYGLRSVLVITLAVIIIDIIFTFGISTSDCNRLSNILQNIGVVLIPIFHDITYTPVFWIIASIASFILAPVFGIMSCLLTCICYDKKDNKDVDEDMIDNYKCLFFMFRVCIFSFGLIPLWILTLFLQSYLYTGVLYILFVFLILWPCVSVCFRESHYEGKRDLHCDCTSSIIYKGDWIYN